MQQNTQDKSLVKVNVNSIFYKIKHFFKSIFSKNKSATSTEACNIQSEKENKRYSFIEEIKKIEDENTILLKLQTKYRNGEIKEEDLTQEQINSLCSLYDKQISDLKKLNEIRKQKLLEYRKNKQINTTNT